MIKVRCNIKVYELDGCENNKYMDEETNMLIESHWNDRDRVNISFGGHTCTVVAKDLLAAIENTQNIARH